MGNCGTKKMAKGGAVKKSSCGTKKMAKGGAVKKRDCGTKTKTYAKGGAVMKDGMSLAQIRKAAKDKGFKLVKS